MSGKVIITVIFLLLAAAAGVWIYYYSIDPLHASCKDVNADPTGLGERAADAVYNSLPDAAKARTTIAGTRMHVVSACQVSDPTQNETVQNIRNQIAHDLTTDTH